MRNLLILSIGLLFTGCFSVGLRGDYRSYQNDFNNLVSKPIKEKDRKELENQFKELKVKVYAEEFSKKDKESLLQDIDYYLMILEDLKD
ncbi:MAG: hypothetical protein ACRCVB_04900 [Cetobacterium sp.]|uniref:hypothetical protein n=1 Tax=unclassified Cetobacterium TaxID=2630983 RepID=UPI000648C2BA|nr:MULTISPECIES: hypothetical protein [unclassified Cetobacterium]